MTKNFVLEQLIMVGFDHKHTPLEIRETVSFTIYNTDKAYEKFKKDNKVSEVVILSTCNRSELYAVVKDYNEGEEYLKHFFADFFNVDYTNIEEYLVSRSKKTLIKHLFEVACGFQSLVLGEDQVLGQVKESYKTAIKCNAAGKILSRLFLDCITSAKKIKALTGISRNSLSVSAIGVRLIEQKLVNLTNKNALVIGLGEMSRITVQNLLAKQIGKIYVTNRTRRRITDFAKSFPDVIQIDFKNRYEIIGDVDIIVSCTAAPHSIIRNEKFLQYYTDRPLCILDLAIPRDIDPNIGKLNAVDLYRIDDLEKIAQENIDERLKAKEIGIEIINDDVKKYVEWIKESKTIDLIVTIQDYSKKIVNKELSKLQKKLNTIDENQMKLIENSFNSLAKSFIHQPMVKSKELAKENEDYRKILSDIFTLEEELQ